MKTYITTYHKSEQMKFGVFRLRSTGLSVSDLSADLSTPLSGELSSDDDEEDETEVRHI